MTTEGFVYVALFIGGWASGAVITQVRLWWLRATNKRLAKKLQRMEEEE